MLLSATVFLAACAGRNTAVPSVGSSMRGKCSIAYFRDTSDRYRLRGEGIALWNDGFVITMFRSATSADVYVGRAPEKEVVELIDLFRESSLARTPSRSFMAPHGPESMLYVNTGEQVSHNYWDEITTPGSGAFMTADENSFREFYEFAVDW